MAGETVDTHEVFTGGLYRIKSAAENSIGKSISSEELIVALARLPDTPSQLTFDDKRSSRFQNVLIWG